MPPFHLEPRSVRINECTYSTLVDLQLQRGYSDKERYLHSLIYLSENLFGKKKWYQEILNVWQPSAATDHCFYGNWQTRRQIASLRRTLLESFIFLHGTFDTFLFDYKNLLV